MSLLLLLVGCGADCEQTLAPQALLTGDQTPFADYDPAACTPDERAWQDNIAPVVQEKCSSCHDTEPQFGAPNTLVDYAELLEGLPGNRPVDRMAVRSATHTMPPANSPQLDHEELDNLVSWATCGEVHADPSIGLVVDREPYTADAPQNAELPSFDVLATAFQVTPSTLDQYQCFAMDVPIDEPRFIKRMQVTLDDARVLHHVVLHHDRQAESADLGSFDCDSMGAGRSQQLWAWAPGTGAFDFEEGGLELNPGERLIVEIHYNNGAGLSDVEDSSGVRIFHGPVEDLEWTLAALGPDEFEVPQGESAVCSQDEVFGPKRLLAGMPHMHELGAEFDSWIERANGETEDLVHLTGWSFESQHFYEMGTLVDQGDVLHTRCGYRNETGADASSGLRTQDEMCFNFLFVGPQ